MGQEELVMADLRQQRLNSGDRLALRIMAGLTPAQTAISLTQGQPPKTPGAAAERKA
ncbi:hypothetical protein ACFOWE_30335 [Planomonospora corallina]|uniref:Uncharacterized protein n=1 Tax=Planomonospora corallina TaxID=1806052 RepID=A0ABV8IHZ6_9ACTN